MTHFFITEVEKSSAVWLRLTKHYEERLEMLRRKLERQQTEIETATLRGQISEIKGFFALTAELPKIE